MSQRYVTRRKTRTPSEKITVKDLKDYLEKEKISFEDFLKQWLAEHGYLKEEEDEYISQTDLDAWIKEVSQ